MQVPVAPAAAFNLDTFGFCKPSHPEFLLMLIFLCLSVGNALAGSATLDVTGYFESYKVAFSPNRLVLASGLQSYVCIELVHIWAYMSHKSLPCT